MNWSKALPFCLLLPCFISFRWQPKYSSQPTKYSSYPTKYSSYPTKYSSQPTQYSSQPTYKPYIYSPSSNGSPTTQQQYPFQNYKTQSKPSCNTCNQCSCQPYWSYPYKPRDELQIFKLFEQSILTYLNLPAGSNPVILSPYLVQVRCLNKGNAYNFIFRLIYDAQGQKVYKMLTAIIIDGGSYGRKIIRLRSFNGFLKYKFPSFCKKAPECDV